MKATYSFILVLFVKIILGQNDTANAYKNQIKISPVRLISAVRGIQASYERQCSDKYSTQLTVCYMIDLFPNKGSDLTKLTGYSFGIEQKYFLYKTKHKAVYVSADFTFLNTNFNMVHAFGFGPTLDSSKHHYSDTIGVNRKTYTLSLKYGFQFYVKHFVFDLNLGLGLRYRDVTHANKLHLDGVWEKRLEPSIGDELFNSGQYFTFNIPLGLKIGYRF